MRTERNRRVHPVGVEPDSISSIQDNTLENPASCGAAKSGAVPADAMLTALVAMLTPEQKAAFTALLTSSSNPQS